MSIGSIIQFILALPRIWQMYLDIEKRIKDAVAKREKEEHDAAVLKLKQAQSEKEIKDALKDLANNP